MLEAAISLRIDGETPDRTRYDFVCVKLAGSPWSDTERKLFLIIEHEDAELEAALGVLRDMFGAVIPCIANPYADAKFVETSGAEGDRSTKKFDPSKLGLVEAELLDPETAKETVGLADSVIAVEDKPQE